MRGLLQRSQIDVEKRVPVHHQEPGIERFARDGERARGAERRLFAQHPKLSAADPAPVIGRLENLAEIAAEQQDVLIAVAFDHLDESVEERFVAGDSQHRLRDGLSDRPEPRALAAREDQSLPDRLAHERPAGRFSCPPQTRSASAAARKT